jgi:heat shock protein HslJ
MIADGSSSALWMKGSRTILGIVVVHLFTLSMAAASMINLTGTEWEFPEETAKAAPFLQFRSDGKVGGSTGCNRFTGTYSQDGHALIIGMLATTRRACPPKLMEREQWFLAMLAKVRRAEANNLELTLKDTDRKVLAKLTRRDVN